MNKGFIVGNMVCRPNLSINTKSGSPWVKIRIAYDNHVTDVADFFDIFFSGRNAEILAQYGEKGKLISVEYRLGVGSIKNASASYKTVDLYGVDFNFLSSVKEISND